MAYKPDMGKYLLAIRRLICRVRASWWIASTIIISSGIVLWLAHKRNLFPRFRLAPGSFEIPGLVAGTIVALTILWKVPQWQARCAKSIEPKELFNSENEARKTLATILGGAVVFAGAYFTWRNVKLTQESVATAEKALIVSQEGQITDRFGKAVEQLGAVDAAGKEKLEIRLGGIYALERIANESERDHWPIMEILCTYVREHAQRKENDSYKKGQTPLPFPAQPTADIQAILTVIGRRDHSYEREDQYLDLSETDIPGVNLAGADLRKANLSGANLHGAFLGGAHLRGAYLAGADLRYAYLGDAELDGAYLEDADLRRAQLDRAHLRGAQLIRTDLRDAVLRDADLTKSYLREAHFGGTILFGANLSGAVLKDPRISQQAEGLTQQQIDFANGDTTTQLPDNLHTPDQWKQQHPNQ
jgi:uncharacterized protein YjbI with pentapeptide repeats